MPLFCRQTLSFLATCRVALICLSNAPIVVSWKPPLRGGWPLPPIPWSNAFAQPPQSSHDIEAFPTRRRLFSIAPFVLASLIVSDSSSSYAFDGGVGGLGKTKPQTGVVFLNPDVPAQQTSAGIVTAELSIGKSNDVALVSFQAPWPLLGTTAGLEARDIATSDAAFCQVVVDAPSLAKAATPKEEAALLKQVLQESVLATQGKFGMYGAPTNIKVKPVQDDSALFQLSFTTLTPGMRESDRKYYVSVRNVANSFVLLLVGTTAARFVNQEPVLRSVAQSWEVIPAPKKTTRSNSPI